MSEAISRATMPAPAEAAPQIDPAPFVRRAGDGTASLTLLVDGIHCANCVATIERALAGMAGVTAARVNFTTRRLTVSWREDMLDPGAIVERLAALGYPAVPFAVAPAGPDQAERRFLLRCLAVAGFAAANVMLLSVSVWSGAAGDMDQATRGFFHWLSALIVLPATAYAVRPFARAALAGLVRGEMRMDLPITVAVVLTAGVSLFETARGGPHVYFEAAAMLLFFLLIGRVLDRAARARALAVAENLLVLRGQSAVVLTDDGRQRAVAVSELVPGMTVLVAAGARVPADGRVRAGTSDVDTSLVSGESVPVAVAPGDDVLAGMLNGTAPLTVAVTAAGEDTVLAEITRLMEAAAEARPRRVAIAERAARIYAPVVHLAALATFLLWWGALGAPWPEALMTAVAVLIITCPCALGLAVPIVQVVAGGRLLARGVVVKAGDALERLAEVDTVVFDKTGTLTTGMPVLDAPERADTDALDLAARMAAASRHPLCRALHAAAGAPAVAEGVREHPGQGLALETAAGTVRLGSRAWAGADDASAEAGGDGPELWLARPNRAPVRFAFTETLREDAQEVVAALAARGFAVELLSGDREAAVARAARGAGIEVWRAACPPEAKIARLRALAARGRRVLMVGDGLNDAPALAAAHVSMSPAAAADVTQAAADVVFQGARLGAVTETLATARRARRLMSQNLGLALLYNLVAVPLAVAGLVTPLIAAASMSASSIVVTVNGLRAGSGRRVRR